MQNGFIQFTDDNGHTVTSNGTLSFVKAGNRNLAFYGSKGRSELSNAEFERIHKEIGIDVPQVIVNDTDDDTDFTLPS
jgi:hypothetical protein